MARIQRPNRSYSLEFKRAVVQEFLSGESSLRALGKRHGISRTLITLWARKYASGDLSGEVARELEREELAARVALLERKIGQLTLENELLKKTLPRSRLLSGADSSIVSGPRRSAARKDAD